LKKIFENNAANIYVKAVSQLPKTVQREKMFWPSE